MVVTALQFKIHLRNVQHIQSTGKAFAAISGNGSVISWVHPRYGGDSSAIQDQLQNVRQIQGTRGGCGAFAAILCDGLNSRHLGRSKVW